MSSKFDIFTGKNGQFYFHFKSSNGEIILASEAYTTKEACKKAVEAVKKYATEEKYFEKKDTGNDKHMFNLKAANGEVIGSSQIYSSTESRQKGIDSLKKGVAAAIIHDLS